MSQTIDSKVVEMRFDNEQFEKNVQTSLSTVDKLKKSLNFDGVSKGFENIEAASKGVNFQAVGDAIENVKVKFSALEIIAITALSNITNKIVDAGINLSKSLSIDQVTAGWSKYAQKTSSVQTIMAATNSSWQTGADGLARVDKLLEEGLDKNLASRFASTYAEVEEGAISASNAAKKLGMSKDDFDKYSEGLKEVTYSGSQMDFVSDQLDKLNWFSDETSYSFVDMTSNIGKFTSTGQQLTDSVTAMQGISTWAALSGANVEQASRAMYNLSQALGQGAVKLMDWKSIENANMATAEFKQTALDTAVELGMLKKTTDGLYKTLDKGTEVSIKNFNASLAEGWFSTDVLMSTLDKYGAFTDKLYEASDKTGMTATQLLKATEKYKEGTLDLAKTAEQTGVSVEDLTSMFDELGSETYDLGRRAFQAAQEAKTFQEAIDATKDAVSTGWMNTFELIFGNYEEAKELWTNVANELYDIFAAGAEARNELLGGWKDLGGRTAMLEAFANIWGTLKGVIETVKEAFHDIFPPMTAERLVEITEHIRDLTEKFKLSDETTEKLKDTFKGLFSILDIFVQIGKSVLKVIGRVLSFLPGVGDGVLGITSSLGKAAQSFDEFLKRTQVFEKAVDKISEEIKTFMDVIKFGFIQGGGGITGVAEAIFDGLLYFVDRIFGLLSKITGIDFSGASDKIKSVVQKIRDAVVNNLGGLIDYLKNFFSNIREDILVGFWEGGGGITGVVEVIFDVVADLTRALFDLISKLTGIDFSGVKDKVVTGIQNLRNSVVDNLEGLINYIKDFPTNFKESFNKITGIDLGEAFDNLKEKVSGAYEKIKEAIEGFKDVDTSGVDELGDKVKDKFAPITAIFEGLKKVFGAIVNAFKKLSPLFSKLAEKFGEALGHFGGAISDGIDHIDMDSLLDLVDGGILAMIALGIKKIMDALSGIGENAGGILKSVKGVLDGVKDSLKAWQDSLKAKTLMTIATAIGVLTASILVLSLIDEDKLTTALAAITTEFIELMGALKYMTKTMSGQDSKNLTKAATTLVLMSVAVLILSSAMKKLSQLEYDEIAKGGTAIAALSYILVKVADSMSKNEKRVMKGATSLIAFAVAIRLLVKPVKELGALDMETLSKGLFGLLGMIASLALFFKTTDLSGMSVGKGLGILVLAEAIKVLGKSVKAFGELDSDVMLKGLSSLVIVLLSLATFVNLTGDSKRVISTATGMAILGAAMLIFQKAIEKMGQLSWMEIGKGLTTMGLALAMVAIAINNLPKSTVIIGAGLVLVGAALMIIASAVSKMGSMGWEEIGKGIVALAGSLLIIVVALKAMSGTLTGSLAMMFMATALLMLVPVLKILGGMKLTEIGKALLALAGIFVVIGVAGAVLGPLIPAILGLAAAILLLGTGVLVCAAGLMLFATALAAFSAAGTAGIAVFVLAVEAILSLIPQIVVKIGEGILKLIEVVAAAAPELIKAFKDIVLAVLETAEELIPKIIEIVDKLLAKLAEHAPSISQSVVKIVKELIKAVKSLLGEIVDLVLDVILSIVNGIKEKMPQLVQAGIDLIIAFIDGLGQGLVDNAEKLRDAFIRLFKNIWEAICRFFGVHSPSTKFAELGMNLIRGLIKGLWMILTTLLETVAKLMLKIIQAISEKLAQFIQKGKEIIGNIIKGIKEKAQDIWDAVTGAIGHAIEAAVSAIVGFVEKGREIIGNIVSGINETLGDIWNAITGAVGHGISAAADAIGGFFSKGAEIIGKICSGIKSAWSTIWDSVKNAIGYGISAAGTKIVEFFQKGKDIMNKMKEGVRDAWDKLKGAVTGAVEFAINGVKSLWDKLVEIGEWVVKGIKYGINKAKNLLGDGIRTAAEEMAKTCAKTLGISSPSKVFAKLGEYTMMGLPVGFKKELPYVLDAIDDSGNTMIDAMTDILSKVYDSFDQDMDYEPTITPVIDLSNVESGAESINDIFSGNRSMDMAISADNGVNQQIRDANRNLEATEELKKLLKDNPGGDEVTTINNTFNIKSDNPNEVAEEVSRKIQRQIERRDAVWA